MTSANRPYIFKPKNHDKDLRAGRREWPRSRVWNTSGWGHDKEKPFDDFWCKNIL